MANLIERVLAEPTDAHIRTSARLLFMCLGAAGAALVAAGPIEHWALARWGSAGAAIASGWPLRLSLCAGAVGGLVGLGAGWMVDRTGSQGVRRGIFRCAQFLILAIFALLLGWSVYGLVAGPLPGWFYVALGAASVAMSLILLKPIDTRVRALLAGGRARHR